MKKLSDEREFLLAKSLLENVVCLSAELPDYVFSNKMSSFRCADYYSALNIEFVRAVVNAVGSGCGFLYFLDPDPFEYREDTGYFSVIEYSGVDDPSDIFRAIHSDSLGDSAFPLGVVNYRMVYFSSSGEWAIYCDRQFEVCIIGAISQGDVGKICSGLSKEFGGGSVCVSVDEFFSESDAEIGEELTRMLSVYSS